MEDGAGEARAARDRGRTWPRALTLLFAAWTLTAVGPNVLVGIPLIMMAVFLPTRRPAVLVAGGVAAVLAASGSMRGGLWFAERGWAVLVGGWFVALTFRRPDTGFVGRALGAVAGSVAVTATILLVRPGSWAVLDWAVGERIRRQISRALTALGGRDALPESLTSGVYSIAEGQLLVFPGTLALASVAALGVAWWLYVRLARGGADALPPLREFDFDDHLVWVLLAGFALVAVAGWADPGRPGLDRAGWNAVVFMGGLYAVRGAAVTAFVTGGISFLGMAVLVVALVLVWPVIVLSAAMIGLGDTWLHVRERAKESTAAT